MTGRVSVPSESVILERNMQRESVPSELVCLERNIQQEFLCSVNEYVQKGRWQQVVPRRPCFPHEESPRTVHRQQSVFTVKIRRKLDYCRTHVNYREPATVTFTDYSQVLSLLLLLLKAMERHLGKIINWYGHKPSVGGRGCDNQERKVK